MVCFEEELKCKLKQIEIRYYIVFISTIICGLFAHLYQFTNKLFNFDELGQTPAGFGAGIELGRWGLQLIGDTVGLFFRTYSLPMVNGMITLICIALAACILVEIFDIKDYVCCFLIGGILATFPALVGTYFFMFTAPYYGFAMFLSCVAAKSIVKGILDKSVDFRNIIIGFLCLTLSTGIYQSYCSVTLCIILMDVILRLYLKRGEWKSILIRGILYCVIFITSLGTYIGIAKIASKISGIALSGYRGIEDMGSVNLGALAYSIIKTYINYFSLMTKEDIYQINPIFLVNIIIEIINIVLVVIIVNRLREKEAIINKIGFIIAIILMPIAMFFPEVMTQARGGVYSLMTYSVAFVFILPIVLYEKRNRVLIQGGDSFNIVKKDIVGRMLCISVFINILVYIWFANGNYQALQYTTYHDLAYFETIATQVKSLDEYTPDLKVALVGDGFEDPTFKAGSLLGEYFDIAGKWDTNINYFNNVYLWKSYLGFTPEIIEFRDSGYLSEMDEVKSMPCYPEDGSIAIVGDTVVIKASEIADK